MDASRKNPGSIHDEKRLIQFSRLCRKSGHISAGGENPLSAGDNSHSGAGTVIVGVNSLCITGVAIDIEDSLAFVGVDDVDEALLLEVLLFWDVVETKSMSPSVISEINIPSSLTIPFVNPLSEKVIIPVSSL